MVDTMKKWEQLHTEIVLDTPYFNMRKDACRLPDGQEIDDYYVLQSPDIVLVVAITATHDFVLVEQYKHGIGEVCLEIPGGMCELNSPDILADAKRELREETGYVSDEWHQLANFTHSPTRMNSRETIYLALNAQSVGAQQLDPNEDITIHLLPKSDIMPAIRKGDINVADSVSGLMMALDWLAEHKA